MTDITLSPLVYIALAINGLFTGLGSALGSYLATKHLIKGLEKLTKKIKGVKKV